MTFNNQYIETIEYLNIKRWDDDIVKQIKKRLIGFTGFVKISGNNFDFLPASQLKINLERAYKMIKRRYRNAKIYFIEDNNK